MTQKTLFHLNEIKVILLTHIINGPIMNFDDKRHIS